MRDEKYLEAKRIYFDHSGDFDCIIGDERKLFDSFNIPENIIYNWNREFLDMKSRKIYGLFDELDELSNLNDKYNIKICSIIEDVETYVYSSEKSFGENDLNRILDWLSRYSKINAWKIILSGQFDDMCESYYRRKTAYETLLIDDNSNTKHKFDCDRFFHYDDFNGLLALCHNEGKIEKTRQLIDICFIASEQSGAITLSKSLFNFINKYYPDLKNEFSKHCKLPQDFFDQSDSFNFEVWNYKYLISDYEEIENLMIKKNIIRKKIYNEDVFETINEEYTLYQGEKLETLLEFFNDNLEIFFNLCSYINTNFIQNLYILEDFIPYFSSKYVDKNNYIYLNKYKNKIDTSYRKLCNLLIRKNEIDSFEGLIITLYKMDYYLYSLMINDIKKMCLLDELYDSKIFYDLLYEFYNKTNDYILEKLLKKR